MSDDEEEDKLIEESEASDNDENLSEDGKTMKHLL